MIDITPQRVMQPDGTVCIIEPNYVDFMPDPNAPLENLEDHRRPVHMPSTTDAFGFLKKACNLMDKRHALARAAALEQTTKYNAEIGKSTAEVKSLINAHMEKLQQEITQQKH